MPEFYQVLLNGVPLFRRMSKKDAEAKAEKWQGCHANGRGLLKIKDRGDWVTVKRDTDAEKEFDRDYDDMKRGKPQTYHMIQGG